MTLQDLATFQPPFVESTGKYKQRIFRRFIGHAGVYIIKENSKVVYVGMSGSCVVKACYTHFYPWERTSERTSKRILTYADTLDQYSYEIAMLSTCKSQALKLEAALIVCLTPRDNAHDASNEIKAFINQYQQKNGISSSDDLPF